MTWQGPPPTSYSARARVNVRVLIMSRLGPHCPAGVVPYAHIMVSGDSFVQRARSMSDEVHMSEIEFSKDEKEIIIKKIKLYFAEELQQDIGQFDAQFLLDFFAEEIGPFFYNRGLYDAQSILEKRLDDISEAIYDLEKVTQFRR